MVDAVRCWSCGRLYDWDEMDCNDPVPCDPGYIMAAGKCLEGNCGGACFPVGNSYTVYLTTANAEVLRDILSRCKLPEDMDADERSVLHSFRREVEKMQDIKAEVALSGVGEVKNG